MFFFIYIGQPLQELSAIERIPWRTGVLSVPLTFGYGMERDTKSVRVSRKGTHCFDSLSQRRLFC